MFQRIKILSVLIMISGFVSTAQAGLLVEPYLGYHTGETDFGTSKEDLGGVSFGARVGYQHALGLMFGLDYMTGKWEDDSTPANDITPSMLGVFVGYEFPILMRVYGVYSLSNESKFKNSVSSATVKGDGAIKLGVGFTALPLLSINLEYIMATYDESGGATISPEWETSMYGVTLSIPFDL